MLKKLKLTPKLIGLFLLTGIIPLLIVGVLGLAIAKGAIQKKTENQLNSIRTIKRNQILDMFEQTAAAIETFEEGRDVVLLYDQLKAYHDRMGTKADGNYNITTSEYKYLWNQYGNYFQKALDGYGYSDILLISLFIIF